MKLKVVREKIDKDLLHFKLTGEMNVYSSAKLKDALLKELKSCSGMSMDLSEVDEADSSAFQLLLFFKREAGILGKSFKVTEMSSRLRNIFNLYRESV